MFDGSCQAESVQETIRPKLASSTKSLSETSRLMIGIATHLLKMFTILINAYSDNVIYPPAPSRPHRTYGGV